MRRFIVVVVATTTSSLILNYKLASYWSDMHGKANLLAIVFCFIF